MLVTVLTILVTNIHCILYKRRTPTFKRCHQHHCYQKAFERTEAKTCMKNGNDHDYSVFDVPS